MKNSNPSIIEQDEASPARQSGKKDGLTWPGLVVWVFEHPKTLLVVVLGLVIAYASVRVAGFDALDLIRPSISGVRAPLDITGEWKYRCISQHDQTEWGGVLYIEPRVTPYGIMLDIKGDRTWMRRLDTNGLPVEEQLARRVPWNSRGGAFVSDSEFVWFYETHGDPGRVANGFSKINIITENRRVLRMHGTFAFVPPEERQFGTAEIRRVVDNDDGPW